MTFKSFYHVKRRGWAGKHVVAMTAKRAAEDSGMTGRVKVVNGSTGSVSKFVVIYDPETMKHTAIWANDKRVRHL